MPQVQNNLEGELHSPQKHILKTKRTTLTNILIVLVSCIISLCRADIEYLIENIDASLIKQQANMFTTPLSELFWVTPHTDTTYTLSKESFGTIVDPSTVLESSKDIQQYNYGSVDMMRKVNETSFVGIFEGKEIAVQHTNGTGNHKLQLFERQIFNTEPVDMDCQDLYSYQFWNGGVSMFFNRIYLLCDPKDPKIKGKSYIYTIVDGSSIVGPFTYDVTILNGRSRTVLVNALMTNYPTPYLLQFDGTFWDSQRQMLNFRMFGFDTLMQVANFGGIKSFKVEFMSEVFNIYPRGNNVLIYGIYKKKIDPSSGSSGSMSGKPTEANGDKDGK